MTVANYFTIKQFELENTWLLMADSATLAAFYARWERAGGLPGAFYGGGERAIPAWGYWKDPTTSEEAPADYRVSVHWCSCPDAISRAPNGWCKHRIAVWILDRHLRKLASDIVRSDEDKLADLFAAQKPDRFPLRKAA